MMKRVRILLVDDHQIFRDGIISLFSNEYIVNIIDVASNWKDAVSKTERIQPELIILDISMPEVSGIELIEKLKENNPLVKILILSMHTKEQYIFQAVRAGANGYLAKQDTSKEELIEAIKVIMENREYYSESISQIMKEHYLRKARQSEENKKPDYERLTPREKEVLKLVVEGLSNRDIAEKLFVTIRTIETHKTNILQKLNLNNSVDLVKFAIKHNLVEL